MNYETMMNELANHEQTKDLPKDDNACFAKMAIIPENFDTIICYLEQDNHNALLYTKKMFSYLAQQDGVKLPIHTSIITNAIVDIFKHHIMDASTFVEITPENEIALTLLQMKDRKEEPKKSEKTEETKESEKTEETKESVKEEIKETTPNENEIDNDITEKIRLVKRQLKRTKKKANQRYIQRAAEIYDDIEDCILKCRANKKIHKLFGNKFTKTSDMDTIISAIKQIVTQCDDDSEQEQETSETISEQVGNHINGFTLERNIVAPISDISYAVKQQFMTSSINNINAIESYTSTMDNPFVQIYVNQTLRNMRNKCIAHIG